ncbi:hypothetical protein [Nocardia iowensis]|uniref:Uncharacterized protein n=1 Tax=Nocardia iowensis TaxID=204891 RepID=A0ABX8RP28_NOCIO|nr:hypothetical protein [Nocardia iowensis]QXN90165.1 hypothetical protein KV110_32800 [Nocardia iowensis]
MAGTYSNRTDSLQRFAEAQIRIEKSGPRRSVPSQVHTSGGSKKPLGQDELAEIIAKYEAGAFIVQLKVEHHMAKRTVAKALRGAAVTIRPRGGQRRPTLHTTKISRATYTA